MKTAPARGAAPTTSAAPDQAAAPPADAAPAKEAAPPADWAHRFKTTRFILGAGALAAAIGAILTFGGTVRSWFESPKGTVSALEIRGTQPLTYGQWRQHELDDIRNVPRAQRDLPGQMISYDVDTSGFETNTVLPVQLTLNDQTKHKITMRDGDPIRVKYGPECGCADWVLTPDRGHRYTLEIRIYPPGPIRGSPLKTITSDPFVA